MKLSPGFFLAALAFTFAPLPSSSLAAYMPVARQVERLDQLVSLTADQGAKAAVGHFLNKSRTSCATCLWKASVLVR